MSNKPLKLYLIVPTRSAVTPSAGLGLAKRGTTAQRPARINYVVRVRGGDEHARLDFAANWWAKNRRFYPSDLSTQAVVFPIEAGTPYFIGADGKAVQVGGYTILTDDEGENERSNR